MFVVWCDVGNVELVRTNLMCLFVVGYDRVDKKKEKSLCACMYKSVTVYIYIGVSVGMRVCVVCTSIGLRKLIVRVLLLYKKKSTHIVHPTAGYRVCRCTILYLLQPRPHVGQGNYVHHLILRLCLCPTPAAAASFALLLAQVATTFA